MHSHPRFCARRQGRRASRSEGTLRGASVWELPAKIQELEIPESLRIVKAALRAGDRPGRVLVVGAQLFQFLIDLSLAFFARGLPLRHERRDLIRLRRTAGALDAIEPCAPLIVRLGRAADPSLRQGLPGNGDLGDPPCRIACYSGLQPRDVPLDRVGRAGARPRNEQVPNTIPPDAK